MNAAGEMSVENVKETNDIKKVVAQKQFYF